MRPTLLFDVEGTLLDPRALDVPVAAAFGDASARTAWSTELERLTFVCALAAGYHRWSALAGEALRTVERRRGVTLDDAARAALLGALARLPAYPDVPQALARLQEHGFALHALSNADGDVVEAQLQNAGLARFFRSIQSADLSETFKPKAANYRNALTAIDVAPGDAVMITAHAWDAVGASAAGMTTAFLARDGTPPSSLARRAPAIVAHDLAGVTERLLFFPLLSGVGV